HVLATQNQQSVGKQLSGAVQQMEVIFHCWSQGTEPHKIEMTPFELFQSPINSNETRVNYINVSPALAPGIARDSMYSEWRRRVLPDPWNCAVYRAYK